MVYDADNRVVSVNSVAASYTYDGNGLRVKKVAGGTATVYILVLSGANGFSGAKVVAEYENGALPTAPSREYIYSGSALLATIDSTGTKYHMGDHLSARITTDSAGTVIGEQGHFPFGEDWYSSNATTKFQFTSYERDSESGNDYAMARYDINRLGRFSSPDPLAGSISDPQSLNRYAYTRNDPVNLTDPSGKRINCEFKFTVTLVNLGGHFVPKEDLVIECTDDGAAYGPGETIPLVARLWLVHQFNMSPFSDALINCVVQRESGGNPNAVPLDKNGNPIPNMSARGLMQVTRGAAADVHAAWPNAFPTDVYAHLFEPVTNIAVGSTYLEIRFVRAGGDLRTAIAGYGTGDQYATDILDCERKLKQ